MSHTTVVILAVRNSSRIGSPAQLRKIDREQLIRRAAETALSSVCDSVIIVLGPDAAGQGEALAGLPVEIVENAGWGNGIGSSICAGVEAAQTTAADGIILALPEQLLASAAKLNKLVLTNRATGRNIVASQDAGNPGMPAYFERGLFSELMTLGPDEGCKRIILKHPDRTFRLTGPEEVVIDPSLDDKRLSDQLVKRDR